MSDNTRVCLFPRQVESPPRLKNKEDINKEKLDVSQSIKGFLFIYNKFFPESVRKIPFRVKIQDADRSLQLNTLYVTMRNKLHCNVPRISN
jgi:hypothetical protein